MAREIIKTYNTTYGELDDALIQIDVTWGQLKTWDKFKFAKHPYKTYYINPLSDSIDNVFGPYKVFDILGNTLQIEKSSNSFKASKDLFKYGPIITYLKTDTELLMLFVSRNAVTDELKEEQIVVNNIQQSTISIHNTTSLPIYYALENTAKPSINLIEIAPNVIEVIQPTSVLYLQIKVNNNLVNINSTNTRTKTVDNKYLLICPTTTSKIQAAKLTGNPISTINDELDLVITI